MNSLIIYTPALNNRLQYAAEYILEDLLGLSLRWVLSESEFTATRDVPKISLSASTPAPCVIPVSDWLLHPSSKFVLPCFKNIDVFSLVFFLLSRYEEYNPSLTFDKYGRFSGRNSYLYGKGLLQEPVVNIRAMDLRKQLQNVFPSLQFTPPPFEILPTIDIDNAFLVKHKGFLRAWGGILRYPKTAGMRLKTLLCGIEDPFFNIEKIVELHNSLGLRSKVFILCGNYGGVDGCDVSAFTEYAQVLNAYDDIEVGTHLSYRAMTNIFSETISKIAETEKTKLESAINKKIVSNRNHFLTLRMPDTYKTLLQLGIKNDYTMGFADEPGFRAGCCTPFHWYDIQNETKTTLKIFPLTCMDATFFNYLKVDKNEAFGAMLSLREKVRSVGGVFIPLFHNETLTAKHPNNYKKLLTL
jgi:hypothetical protein